jgi:hypothetical protein
MRVTVGYAHIFQYGLSLKHALEVDATRSEFLHA